MSIRFEDYSIQVKAVMDEAAVKFLYEAAELLKGQTAQLTPVDTGQLKGSWAYKVDTGSMEAKIGSPIENGIWNELGTGEYAANDDGRKGGWAYQDEKGNWHYTKGKRPNHTLQKAYDAKKNSVKNRAKQLFGGMDD